MSACPPVHRSFSDEHGPGTFHTLGDLPRRKPVISDRKSPVSHPTHDDDGDHSSSLDRHFPQLLSIPPTVPFPRSTSPPSQSSSPSSDSPLTCPRPRLSRGTSTPILLSNGKPLKSSLKASSPSPTMSTPPQAQHMHLRARSEPSTPVVTHKNVHFPEKDYALATIRVFNRSARPAALSNPANGNGDETETEGEEPPSTRFPFPTHFLMFNYEIDPTRCSPVPSGFSPPANLLLESYHLSPSSSSSPSLDAKPVLTGSILVRNVAFEKKVAIRFTLDDWQTVSEVGAHYFESLSLLPCQILLPPSASISGDTRPQRERGWDRFSFTIRLEDYVHSLSTRTLWLAARYRINSTYPEAGSAQYGPGGEWWDNNGGRNYRVGFRPAGAAPTPPRSRPRRATVSAPISSPRTEPQPAMTCKEHAFGLMVPSVPKNKEIQPVNELDRRSMPLRVGKLSLCNYVPPAVRTTSSISFPSAGSPRILSPSSIANPELPSSTIMRPPSDEDTTSPASSTLSTPSVSPTMAPRVMISGQPATFAEPYGSSQEVDALTSSRLGHTVDWDWSALKPRIKGPHRQHADLVPDPESPEQPRDIPSPPGRKALADSNSLYDTFITQWCFSQGLPPNQHGYDHDGITA